MNKIDIERVEPLPQAIAYLCGELLAKHDAEIDYLDGYEDEEVIIGGETLYRKKPIIKKLESVKIPSYEKIGNELVKSEGCTHYSLRLFQVENRLKDVVVSMDLDSFFKMYLDIINTHK